MPDSVTLTCPSCGGKLKITNEIEHFACGHCGNEHVVHRGGGIVSLEPVVQELKRVQSGVNKTASELAIQRLNGEISVLKGDIRQLRRTMALTEDHRLDEYTSSLSHKVERLLFPRLVQEQEKWKKAIIERRERLDSLEEAVKLKEAETKRHKEIVEM